MPTHQKAILVTGCAGFIGGNFVQQFTKKFPKTTIVGIDDFSSGRRDVLEALGTFPFYEGSITDASLLEKIFTSHKPEYVFHFAAIPRVTYAVEHPRETTEVNVGGTVALLEAAAKHRTKRFIFSSSSSIYGGAKKLPTKEQENAPDPKSPYALQKYVGERYCKLWSELYGLDTVCLRYFNVFGPGQYGDSPYSTVIAAWLETIFSSASESSSKKKTPFMEGDGRQSRDFCYADNVVQANIAAMQASRLFKGECINIANGSRTNLLVVKRLIEKYTGSVLNLERRAPRTGDVRHTHADISRAKRLLGYKPTMNFEEGLDRSITWYRDSANKPQ